MNTDPIDPRWNEHLIRYQHAPHYGQHTIALCGACFERCRASNPDLGPVSEGMHEGWCECRVHDCPCHYAPVSAP